MKTIFLTLVSVAMLTTVTLAQSPEESQRDKNSGGKDNPVKKEYAAQDTIERESKRPEPGVGVSESNKSDNSKTDDKETVTQKQKKNKPGLRSQSDEDETGKKSKRSERNNPK